MTRYPSLILYHRSVPSHRHYSSLLIITRLPPLGPPPNAHAHGSPVVEGRRETRPKDRDTYSTINVGRTNCSTGNPTARYLVPIVHDRGRREGCAGRVVLDTGTWDLSDAGLSPTSPPSQEAQRIPPQVRRPDATPPPSTANACARTNRSRRRRDSHGPRW